MDKDLKRMIILENYQNPKNKQIPTEEGYVKINSNNVSCIDNLDIYVKTENDIIKDIKYEGEACVICISSTSIITNLLIGKTIEEAKDILENYDNMIEEKPYNKEEDFVYGIREKLNTILLEVNAEVIKTDIIKEIINTYKNIMDNNYSEAKNKNIKLYLELIQELSRFIEENGNTLEKENLIKILNNNINYQNEIEEVMTTLLDNIISLYKLKYRVENRIKTEKEIESSKIKRKLKR